MNNSSANILIEPFETAQSPIVSAIRLVFADRAVSFIHWEIRRLIAQHIYKDQEPIILTHLEVSRAIANRMRLGYGE